MICNRRLEFRRFEGALQRAHPFMHVDYLAGFCLLFYSTATAAAAASFECTQLTLHPKLLPLDWNLTGCNGILTPRVVKLVVLPIKLSSSSIVVELEIAKREKRLLQCLVVQ